MHDLIIIGGGPGGVAAAAYGLHLGLDTLLIAPDLGGKVNYSFAIRGIRATDTVYGAEMMRTFAANIGPDTFREGSVESVEPIEGGFRVTLEQGGMPEGRSLVLSTGARPRRLYVPGENEYWGQGLSYSAVSHSPFFAGKDVAVVGNDRRAQIAALELARLANRVLFIIPRPESLDEALLERVRDQGKIEPFVGWEIISVEGDDFLTGISLQNKAGTIREIQLDGLFIELGLIPNSDFVAELVERDEQGRIRVDQQARTSHAGIFAAGDVTNVYGEQVPVALGEGIKAALSASEYLVGQEAKKR